MAILLVLFFLFFIIVVLKVSKLNETSKRMICLIIGYWAIALILSAIGVPGLNRPSDYAFVLLFLSIIMFSFGFLSLRSTTKEFTFDQNRLVPIINTIIDSKFFLILLLISAILSTTLFLIMRTVLQQVGDLGEVRTMFFEGTLFGSVITWIMTFFLTPMNYICIPIFGYLLFFNRGWKLLVTFVFIWTYASLGGGRFGYLRIAWGIIFILFCIFHNIRLKLKHWVFLIITMLGLFFLIANVSHARSSSGDSVIVDTIRSFSYYLCGPFSAFDYAMNNRYLENMGGYSYGRLILSSLDDLIYLFMRIFDVRLYNPMPVLLEMKQDSPIEIGDTSWNALYSVNLYYWLDGGFWGCIIIPFFLGRLFHYMVRLFYKYQSWPFFVIISMFFQIFMHMVSDWEFTSPFLLLFTIFLYCKGKKVAVL